MGLADEKIKMTTRTDLARYEENLAKKEMPIKFDVDWATYGAAFTQDNASRTVGVCGEFASRFGNFHLNYDHPEYKMLVDAIRSSFETIKIVNNPTGQAYAYTLEIKDKNCVFTADMSKFCWAASSKPEQPSIRSYLEKIL